ncbi:MAG: Acetolactate synthase large subunit IlvG [Candidatus Heimdallarchaeota archaeon LC_2]|nr:MAG: Acetolactate synthase large subunit IlvG [Candidatus Heimdallarchaeota archaeon LC_2]
MARGLLGKDHPLQLRHKRRMALKKADLIILAGAPMDFRLDYGRHFNGYSKLIFVNLDKKTLNQNKWIKRPTKKIRNKPAEFIISLSKITTFENKKWLKELRTRDIKRNKEIASYSEQETDYVNPMKLCQEIENLIDDDSVLIGDGGDFISTISYIVQPRQALKWLDPGVFGTLGPGAGFALAAKLVNPDSEVWLFYGDGSAGYSLSEFDTFVRHELPIIALLGNDASWQQIAREQVELFEDPIGTKLRYTEYHKVVIGFGGKGFLLDNEENIVDVLKKAKRSSSKGNPVLINALIGKTDFRKGSISM